jgi:protein phosphatase 1L
MEDRSRIHITHQNAFFGVYDGHGGAMAAEFCADNLHVNLSRAINSMWLGMPLLDATDPECVTRISQCVRDAFVCTDYQFLQSQYRHEGGTTACVALLINGTVVVGNVGDSRAVLCRGSTAVPLSHDHTPARQDEVDRIRAAGAQIEAGDVVVGGEEFSLTRAIGNSIVKVPPGRDFLDFTAPQVVTSEPEVSITELVEEDSFLVIASDGIWERISNEEAVAFIELKLREHGDPQFAASQLANYAIINKRGGDNVSIIIIVPRKLPQIGRFAFT